MVRRNDDVVLFNELLVNYGHNKITYVENLRFHGTVLAIPVSVGYQFILAGRCYLFDVPHAKSVLGGRVTRRSEYQKSHIKNRQNSNWRMKTLYLSHLYRESLNRTDVMTLCNNSNPY